MKKAGTYLKLFTSTFYLSAFTFGGGYVIIPLMKRKFVDDLKWLEENEMLDMAAIAQSAPGAVAVNASILLGYRIAGVGGALITMLGTVLPPFIILSVISVFYQIFRTNLVVSAVLRAMRPAVTAVIADVVFSMGAGIVKRKEITSILIMSGAFIASCIFKMNVILIVLLCGAAGLAMTLWREKKEKEGRTDEEEIGKKNDKE